MSHDTGFASGPGNRSMPDATVIPVLQYPDVVAAAEWLCQTFGFTERLRIGAHRIQLSVGAAAVVVAQSSSPTPPAQHSVMVRVVDIDTHYTRAVAGGAKVAGPPTSFPFGERQYSASDIGGHTWTFSQTETDVDPRAWGGEL